MLTSIRALRRDAEDGLTLVELVVALSILAIIIVPLTFAFINGFRTTKSAGQRIDNAVSRQRLAAMFTADVQSLDAYGVGVPGLPGTQNEPCSGGSNPNAEPAPAITTHLVTMSSNIASTAVSPAKKVSYWVFGEGESATIVRSECTADAFAFDTVVAQGFGAAGMTPTDMVHGDSLTPTTVCTSFRCTLDINGSYSYRLAVDRRVKGEGTVTGGPGTPFNVAATAFNRGGTVTWAAPVLDASRPDPEQYGITTYLSATNAIFTGVAADTDADGTVWVDASQLSVEMNGLQNGTGYYFRVVAKAGGLLGSYSAPSNTITPDTQKPGPPTLVQADPGDQFAVLGWSPPANAGGADITGYTLTWTGGGGGSMSVNGDVTSVQVSNLVNATTYTFTVTATNAKGTSDPSNAMSVTPRGRPTEPRNVQFRGDDGVSNAGHALYVQWDAPSNNGGSNIEWYRIQVYAGANFGRDPVATFDRPASDGLATVPAVIDTTNIANGGPYGVRVLANNYPNKQAEFWSQPSSPGQRIGTGAYTDTTIAVASGAPDAPIGVTAVGKSGSTAGLIQVGWTAYVTETETPVANKGNPQGARVTAYRFSIERRSNDGTWAAYGTPEIVSQPSTGAMLATATLGGGSQTYPRGYYRLRMNARNHGEWTATERDGAQSAVTPAFYVRGTGDPGNTGVPPEAVFASNCGDVGDAGPAAGCTVYQDELTWPGEFVAVGGFNSNEIAFTAKDALTNQYWSGNGWNSATPVRLTGDYVNGVWRLPFPMTYFTHGGAYVIGVDEFSFPTGTYTSYTPVNMYLDWKPGETVFVNPTAGVDTANGTTPSTPVRTITKAGQVASSLGSARAQMVVGGGTYNEALDFGTSGYNNRTLTGGFDTSTWFRAPPGSNAVTITAAGRAINLNVATFWIQQLNVTATNSGLAAGSSVYGIRTLFGTLNLANVSVSAGSGVAGTAGTARSAATAGGNGGTGSDSCSDGSGCTTVGAAGTGVRTGGAGGVGGYDSAGGSAGSTGQVSGSGGGAGGGGGAAGSRGSIVSGCGDANGGSGGSGSGSAGTGGTAGSGSTFVLSSMGSAWSSSSPAAGGSGTAGHAGGGGGGGGGAGGYCLADRGAAGGGGGGGGDAGMGGGAGSSGGGSFAVYAYGATVQFTGTVTLSSANGGNGGAGGDGGAGGKGGNGGAGGTCDGGQEGGAGGGGGGGAGGGGGGGGGGGAGGPSIALFVNASGSVVGMSNVTLSRGSAGTAGANGAAGGAGGSGSAGSGGGKRNGTGCNTGASGSAGAAGAAGGTPTPAPSDGVAYRSWINGTIVN